MEEIVLRQINKRKNIISYGFSVSKGLETYFSGKTFVIEYPESVEIVPDSIAAVPFVCNVLPIIWLTNSRLVINELDQAFYECIPNVKQGYETMFPESVFAGEMCVKQLIPCEMPGVGKAAAFFSGGLDAVHTLIRHLDEKPALISIWGADIRFDNEDGWETVHKGIAVYAEKYNLADIVIRSSFREFDHEDLPHKEFSEQLKDGWWHGVKHGMALLGHAAPYAYLHGISTVYIASSHCPADGHVRCASNPLTDNHVRFANARVVHDGFECGRQDKVHDVVDYVNRTGNQLSLRVCWESQSGRNCCHCEKCYRTMASIMAECADPVDYGFDRTAETVSDMQRYIVGRKVLNANLATSGWKHIHNGVRRNKKNLKGTKYWKHLKWIDKADFDRYEDLKLPLLYRIRNKLSTLRFYQFLHEMKVKLRG